ILFIFFFFFQAEDGIRDYKVTGVQTCALPIFNGARYAEVAENQRIRLLPIPAPRGVIFDRNLNVLVDSRPIYSVILSREANKGRSEAHSSELQSPCNLVCRLLLETKKT